MFTAVGRVALRRAAGVACSRGGLAASQLATAPMVARAAAQPAGPGLAAWTKSAASSRSFATVGRPKKAATTTTKKKAPAKKTKAKKAKAKAAPAKKKARVQSPAVRARIERGELRAKALFTEPAKLPATAWLVYVTENLKGKKVPAADFATSIKSLSSSFKALPSLESQRLQSTAGENKLSNHATYRSWVESHPAAAVAEANKARSRLARVYKVPKGGAKPIHDERLPKAPSSAFILFTKSRWAAGEFAGVSIKDASQTLGREWKELSDEARKPFLDLEKAEWDRYEKEVHSVLGHTVKRKASE